MQLPLFQKITQISHIPVKKPIFGSFTGMWGETNRKINGKMIDLIDLISTLSASSKIGLAPFLLFLIITRSWSLPVVCFLSKIVYITSPIHKLERSNGFKLRVIEILCSLGIQLKKS